MADDLSGGALNANPDADELIARGESLLDVLSREAEAARAEARRAELEQVLADARRFRNASQLKVWLDAYNRASRDLPSQSPSESSQPPLQLAQSSCQLAKSLTSDSFPEVLHNSEAAPTTAHGWLAAGATELAGVAEAGKANEAAGNTIKSSWDTFLPAARKRLELRAQLLREGADFAAVCNRTPSLQIHRATVNDQSSAASTAVAGETFPPHGVSCPATSDTKRQKALDAQSLSLDIDPAMPLIKRSIPERAPAEVKPRSPSGLSARKFDQHSSRNNTLSVDQRCDKSQRTNPLLKKTKSARAGGRPQTPQARMPRGLSDSQPQQETRQPPIPQRVHLRSRGLVASAIFHGLVAILLALMTLKLPPPPASLAFESSVSDALETFELSEPLEVISPPDAPDTLPTPPLAIDASESLPELSNNLVSSMTNNIASPTAHLAAGAMAAVRAGSANPSAMPSESSFFGAAASGNYFCYVIDSSGSMRGGAWESAKSELLRSLATLKPNQRFYIIFFNAELQAIPLPGEREPASSALYANPENLQHARRWIDSVKIDKGASPLAALRLAIDLEPDAVYLLTDGVTSVDVPKAVREFNRVQDLINGEQVKAPIHAIAYYSLKGEQLMKRLATENNGQFIYVPDPRRPTR